MRVPLAALMLVLGATSPSLGAQGLAQKVLLVDLDDVGPELLPLVDTPQLDALAQRGRTFTRFYTAPMCTATRALVQLGARGSRPEILCTGNVSGTNTYSLPIAPFDSLAQVVTDAGLRAAKVGKWHLCEETNWIHPSLHGWHPFIGLMANPGTSGGDWFSYPENRSGVPAWVAGQYLTTRETELGLRLLDAGHDLVSVSYHAIHKPFHEPPPHLHNIPPPLDSDSKRASAALQALDAELGRLLARAQALGYLTIVFSDNGTAGPLGGLKGTVWEGGVHTILWAEGPGVVAGTDDGLIEVIDLYATVLELLGITPRAWQGPDSTSFAHRLQGLSGAKNAVIAERGGPAGVDPRTQPHLWRRMVREDRFKLVVNQDQQGMRLYDLFLDPAEDTDLLAAPVVTPAHLQMALRLRAILGQL